MARLAISKGFLADYAKLDKDVRRAVDQAVATFARHSQPGLHLEKPQHVKDDRFRILPVDSRWRGVVLAAGDTSFPDTFSLVTVLPRDQANAYVTSHRFGINRAPEVRDEKAVTQLQPSVSQLQPSLHATREGERLSADVSDPVLTRPGVDAQIMPTVRPLAGAKDPQALPDARHAVLNTPPEPVDPAGTLVSERGKPQFSLFVAWRRFRTRTTAG